MLEQIRNKLKHRPPHPAQPEADHRFREAAVLMAVTQAPDPDVVFIRRADHLSKHGGQVAFPGGMWEHYDASLRETALRESQEEIALPAASVELVGRMDTVITPYSVRVTPYVGIIPAGLEFVPDRSEIDSIFQIPLRHLLEAENYSRSTFPTSSGVFDAPCLFYEGYCLWGLTFRILLDVLDETFDFELERSREMLAANGERHIV
ncbi:MAG: CoA pyrophosphatase [Porticoccaceae bacterium]